MIFREAVDAGKGSMIILAAWMGWSWGNYEARVHMTIEGSGKELSRWKSPDSHPI